MIDTYQSIREARVAAIHEAFNRKFDVDDPNLQVADWVREGVHRLQRGQEITSEILEEIERCGRSLDPWVKNPMRLFKIER